MKKVVLLALLVLIIFVGWFSFKGDSIDYVASVGEEVIALEEELAEIEAAIAAEDLTPEEAAEAQERIATRIDTIQKRIAEGQESGLSDEDKSRLTTSLNRLMGALVTYKDTLTSVDEAVLTLPESARPQLNRGSSNARSGNGGGLSGTVGSLIETVQDFAEDVTEDLIPDELTEEDMDVMEDSGEAGDFDTEGESMEDNETTTDEDMTEGEATTDEESTEGGDTATDDGFGFTTEEGTTSEAEPTN